jgi:hypothetical protein
MGSSGAGMRLRAPLAVAVLFAAALRLADAQTWCVRGSQGRLAHPAIAYPSLCVQFGAPVQEQPVSDRWLACL